MEERNVINIKGIIASNISQLNLIQKYKNCNIIANYTFNCFNFMSIKFLKDMGIHKFILSPELNKSELNSISSFSANTEFIVYGNAPLMTLKYCLLGNTNKCHPECSSKCLDKNNYYLKDRMRFPIPYFTR